MENKKSKIFISIFLISLFMFMNIISALDNQTFVYCDADNQTQIQCVGDAQLGNFYGDLVQEKLLGFGLSGGYLKKQNLIILISIGGLLFILFIVLVLIKLNNKDKKNKK